MTRAAARNAVVLIAGGTVLAAVLIHATTVDAQPARVGSFALSHHLAAADDVALTNSSVEIRFSEPVDRASAEEAFVIVPAVPGTFSWVGTTMSFSPLRRLPLETEFTARIGPGVVDAAGNRSTQPSPPFRFSTVGQPEVARTIPEDGGVVAGGAAISLTFSTLMDTESVERALRITPAVDMTARWSAETLTLLPDLPLDAGETYRLVVDARASDLAGNRLARTFTLEFTAAADVLTFDWVVPADGVAGVSPTGPIAVAFDEPIDPDSISDALLRIEPDVPGSVTLVDREGAAALTESAVSAAVLRFDPAAPLGLNTTYTVELGTGLRAEDGSVLGEPLRFSFTTGAPFPTLENQIVFLSDRAGIRNLWAMNPDGSNERQISAELSAIIAYDVSPDGRRVVVGDGARLVELEADGDARRVLTEEGVVEFDASYRPDGQALVFARADATTGRGRGLWTRESGGGAVQPVPIAPGGGASDTGAPTPAGSTAAASPSPAADESAFLARAPRYSPDGSLLAFIEVGEGVAFLDLATAQVMRVPLAAASAPAWRPDSSEIMIAGVRRAVPNDDGNSVPAGSPVSSVDELAADHPSDTVRLARLGPGDVTPRWLSAVAGIAPTYGRSGMLTFLGAPELNTRRHTGAPWIAADDGSDARALVETGLFVASAVAFGPEPDTLIAARVHRDGATPSESGIWRMATVGGAPTRLSHDGSAARWIP